MDNVTQIIVAACPVIAAILGFVATYIGIKKKRSKGDGSVNNDSVEVEVAGFVNYQNIFKRQQVYVKERGIASKKEYYAASWLFFVYFQG